MLPITQHSLCKLEELLKVHNYTIRYEKGNFKSAACTLLDDKVLVINRFSDLEVKIKALIEIIDKLDFSDGSLDEKQEKLLGTLKEKRAL